jgi:3D (Asp-Asp-Asp) domain-containing protein
MDPLKRNWKKIFPAKFAKKIIIFVLVAFIFQLLLSPVPFIVDATFNKAYAKGVSDDNDKDTPGAEENKEKDKDGIEGEDNSKAVTGEGNNKEKDAKKQNRLPGNKDKYKVVRTLYTTATAYNSEISQCQGDPCITANGFNVCRHGIEDTIATNRLPFGTKIRIPELFGDRIFIVRDRMNKRYYNRIDIWMLDKQEAVNFGIKRGIRVQIVKKR